MDSDNIDVSIIIINYNTYDLTVNCLKSVFNKTHGVEFEVILIDNNSTNCDPNQFLQEFPDIILIISAVNLGFAGGNNLAVKQASGKYLLLLNSDTELLNDAVSIAVAFMEGDENIGALTGKIVYPDGTPQGVTGRFPSLRKELCDLIRINSFLSKDKKIKLNLGDRWDYSKPTEADWIWGTFFCIPKNILNLFPNQKFQDIFFMYYEDVLWCYYIKIILKQKIMYIPQPEVIHYLSGSSVERNREENFKKKIVPNECAFLLKEKGLFYAFFFYLVKGLHYFSLRRYDSLRMGMFYMKFIYTNVLKRS